MREMSRVKELRGEIAVARRLYRISKLAFGSEKAMPSFETIKTMTEEELDALCEGLQPMKLKQASLKHQLAESKQTVVHMHRKMRELEREIDRLRISSLDLTCTKLQSDSEWCVINTAEKS